LKVTLKARALKGIFSKISPTIKCYKCHGYGHVAVNCSSLVKIFINKELPVTNLESDSGEFIYQVEKPEDYDSDEEIKGDDINESRIMSYSQGHPSDYELY